MLVNFHIFYFFASFLLLSAFFVIFSINPIFSVMFLILSFSNVSCLLFSLNLEFLPIAFLVIYVGAISVLFLFVLMTLNIKLAELHETFYNFVPVLIIFGVIFLLELLLILSGDYGSFDFRENSLLLLSDFLFKTSQENDFINFITANTNIQNISQTLFFDFIYEFLLAGFVLLFAMVGAILITIEKTFLKKTQNVYSQILRNYNNSLVSYS
jgi:NADH-quinone oxidoreductase subunit J